MKTFAAILMLAASGCLAARIETITLDLERPQQPFTLTLTEATDSTVSAQLRASGSEFDPTGWTGLLWYGGSDGGQTLTNSTAGYGAMTWSVPVSAMPTNGRYSVQILGSISNRVEEWGRGALTIRINPSRDFLPAQWATNNPAYTAALQALAGLASHAAASNPHHITADVIGALSQSNWQAGSNALANTFQSHAIATNNPHLVTPAQIGALANSSTNGWEVGVHKAWITNETDAAAKSLLGTHTNRTDNPHRVTAVQIGALTNETDARALAALATNRVTRLYSPDATQWIDGTGGVWKVSQSTATAYRITDAYDVGAWQAGDEFYFVSDTTVTNSPYVTRTISYGNLFHVRHGYINNTWDGFGQWGLYVNAPGGFDDCYGDYEYPNIGTLYPGNVDPYVTLESFQKTFTVTNVVDAVQRMSDKELHRDSFTNLIWRTVWSNGWCWAVAYTNTP